MLVLTRRLNESIRIGNNVVITIVEMRGKKVRIGIEAPQGVDILREELVSAAKQCEPASA